VLGFLRKGDVPMVTRIDRLARSIDDLQDIVRKIKTCGTSLKATEQPINTMIRTSHAEMATGCAFEST
jgi:DNA invertase Pin-like site-specific DNA recombinase